MQVRLPAEHERRKSEAPSWVRRTRGHLFNVDLCAGTVVGEAPLLYCFCANDLNDLLPSRVLELNLDHQRTHNILEISIIESDKVEVAAKIGRVKLGFSVFIGFLPEL